LEFLGLFNQKYTFEVKNMTIHMDLLKAQIKGFNKNKYDKKRQDATFGSNLLTNHHYRNNLFMPRRAP